MKIVVYAICKNESQFVNRWMDSMQEADQVVVLDTGSTDKTPALLRRRGALVYEETISPWRFDTARNRSLELVDEDADLCVCTDLDELFRPGWRSALEQVWEPGTTQVRYPYVWSFSPMAGMVSHSGRRRSTFATGIGGCIQFTRCCTGSETAQPPKSYLPQGSGWSTIRIPGNPESNICRCWNLLSVKPRKMTAASTILAGNTSTTGSGTTASIL